MSSDESGLEARDVHYTSDTMRKWRYAGIFSSMREFIFPNKGVYIFVSSMPTATYLILVSVTLS